MIFIKNIIKKKSAKIYFISFVVIIFCLLFLNVLSYKIEAKNNSLKNSLEYRTITINGICDIKSNTKIEKVNYDDNTTIIIIKDYKYLKDVLNLLPEEADFNYNVFEEENNILFSSIQISIYFISIFFIIIFGVFIGQFINDELQNISLLRTMGYKKKQILKYYLVSFICLFTIIYILSFLLSLLLNFVFIHYINLKIFTYLIYSYIFYAILIVIFGIFKVSSLSRKITRHY